MNNQEFDFISIGDIVTDAFIRISQASVYYDDDCHCEKICLENGAKIPYEFAKIIPGAGNSPNAAVSATRLGLKTALVTNLGDDDNGQEILDALKKNNIDQRFVQIHKNKISNYHYVLWHKARRTILIKHQDYDYTFPEIGTPKWIYMSSVGENTIEYQKHIANYVKEKANVKLAFQPGTFQVKLGYEKLKSIYKETDVFFCNLQEAQHILGNSETNYASLTKKITELGPKLAVVTDGPQGAYMFDGESAWHIPVFPNTGSVLESTGAGDSFSSTFTAALALGKTPQEALVWGAINSAHVIQHVGAQEGLLTRKELEEILEHTPNDYSPQKITL